MPRPSSEIVIAQSSFLYNNSKSKHFNGKNICPTEFFDL